MVLAANDVGDTEVDVVDHARQQIEPAAVFAADDRVGQQLGIELLLAADEVGEDDRRIMVELEAPVGRSAVRSRRAFGRALVDRRQPAPQQDLAAKVELLRRLVASVDPARVLQPLELPFVEVEPLRLANHGGQA